MSLILTKENAGLHDPAEMDGMTRMQVGVSWDTSSRGRSGLLGKISQKIGADLDLLAVVSDKDNNPVRFAGLDNLDPLKDGTLTHSGDNTSGKGEGDDELVTVDLLTMDSYYHKIVFAVAAMKSSGVAKAFGDKGFHGAQNVEFTVYDSSSGSQNRVGRIMPSLLGNENCCLVAQVERNQNGGWNLSVINKMTSITAGDHSSILRAAMNI